MTADPAREAAVAALTDVLETVPGVGDPLAAAEALCNAYDARFKHWPFPVDGLVLRNLTLTLRLAEPVPDSQG